MARARVRVLDRLLTELVGVPGVGALFPLVHVGDERLRLGVTEEVIEGHHPRIAG